MVFSSSVFLFAFLPTVLVAYFLAPRGLRNGVLALASLAFYAWGESQLVWLLVLEAAVAYAAGRWIAWRRDARESAAGFYVLVGALSVHLSLLIGFKYFNLVVDTWNQIAVAFAPAVAWSDSERIALPLGISFFTFQAMSYVVDVYRGRAAASRSCIDFAAYLSLFPQLVAGPIVRYTDVSGALESRRETVADVLTGARRFVTGLAKKVLIANTLARPCDAIFALPPDEITLGLAWLGVVCYALQIYFDFSGYTDMALGLGRVFGFRFPENFDYPYVARSLRDFWRRWHISLSTWFRDYVYLPLGGNRGSRGRTALNLLIVFSLCGLWHGASWTFLLWGLYHGSFLALERTAFGRGLERVGAPLGRAYTLVVVLGGWLLFRAESMSQVGAFAAAMAGFAEPRIAGGHLLQFLDLEVAIALAVGALAATPWWCTVSTWLSSTLPLRQASSRASRPVVVHGVIGVARAAWAIGLLLVSVAYLSAQTHNPFIYFRF